MDSASVVAFRVLFGLLMAIAAVRFVANGWVFSHLIAPSYHFSYPGLSFVRPWPGYGSYVHLGVLIAAASCSAIGYWRRLSAGVLAIGFTHLALIDRAYYLNHYYLACLLAWLLVFAPADGTLADLMRGRLPRLARGWLWTLRFQVGCVYVFAGLAKLNSDWLLRAQPLRIWLAARGDIAWLGHWFESPAAAYAASWAGALFDLTIVGFLAWRRTRKGAFVVALAFHGLTGWLFPIGMFPWLMAACLTLFLEPDWPRRWLPRATTSRPSESAPWARWQALLLTLHCAVQVVVPLHHLSFVRGSAWTGEGFDFAWKVMLAEKAGSVRFRTREHLTDAQELVMPRTYLNEAQERALAQDPRLIRAFARSLADEVHARSGRRVAVYADAYATLNGRRVQRLIAPDVDLTRDPLPARWIVPLEPP